MGKFYLSAPIDEVALAHDVAPLVSELNGVLPTPPALREITRARGLDVATALLYHALHAAPVHRALIEAIDSQPPAADTTPARAVLVIVPALFHGHYPETGADAALAEAIARRCGFDVLRPPIRSVGTVTENAHILRDALLKAPEVPLWVFTVSKGGSDFRAFMQLFPDHPAISRVRGWINVSGLSNGCAIADHNIATPMRRLKYRAICRYLNVSYDLMREMATGHAYWSRPFVAPPHMRVINVVAVPLPAHIQKSLMGRYAALAKQGPNDGMVLCRNSILDPYPAYPLWGCDHFFRGPQAPPLLYRLFRHIKTLP
jgi:hypothetical protein